MELIVRYYDQYREEASKAHGYEPDPNASVDVDGLPGRRLEEGERGGAPARQVFGGARLVIPPQMLIPPGYTTSKSLRGFVGHAGAGCM